MSSHSYTVSELQEAISSSISLAEVIRKLHLIPAGGNYTTLKRKIKTEQIDTSHFLGQSWTKNKILPNRRKNVQDYLVEHSTIGSHALKIKLINQNILPKECSICNLRHWLDKDIPLELDHINGVNDDNRLENLRLLCPNCHAFTPTYRGKNKSGRK